MTAARTTVGHSVLDGLASSAFTALVARSTFFLASLVSQTAVRARTVNPHHSSRRPVWILPQPSTTPDQAAQRAARCQAPRLNFPTRVVQDATDVNHTPTGREPTVTTRGEKPPVARRNPKVALRSTRGQEPQPSGRSHLHGLWEEPVKAENAAV